MPKNHMKQALKKRTKASFVQIRGLSVITFEQFMLVEWTENKMLNGKHSGLYVCPVFNGNICLNNSQKISKLLFKGQPLQWFFPYDFSGDG